MRVNAFTPTREEIGDPMAALARVTAFRKQMYAPRTPVQKPVETMVIRLEKPIVIEPRPRNAETKYAQAIQGPCLPDHPKFPFYNGERDVLNIASNAVKIEDCIRYVCETEKISKIDMISSRRTAAVASSRQRAMWLARQYTGRSLPEIGRKFSNRDHTTVLHAVRKWDVLVAAGGWTPPTAEELLAYVRPSALSVENAG